MSWHDAQEWFNSSQLAGHAKRGYRAKYCRSRGCNLPNGHAGDHVGRDRPAAQLTIPNRRRARRGSGSFYGDPGRGIGKSGTNHARLHNARRGGVTSAIARENMARIRARQPQLVSVRRDR